MGVTRGGMGAGVVAALVALWLAASTASSVAGHVGAQEAAIRVCGTDAEALETHWHQYVPLSRRFTQIET